ncbi:hypothetical protein LguiB_022744 [Lonicera macranthoides]
MDQIASFYSVNTSQIRPISRGNKQDFMIYVPCTCKDLYEANRYFYDTSYKVQEGDLVESISEEFYSGQVLKDTAEELQFIAGNMVTMHLVCGCVEREVVVTYTVQEDDTLLAIAELLSAKVSEIENLNAKLTQNPGYIDVGWVLFVPMETKGIQKPKKRKIHTRTIITSIFSGVALLLVGALIFFICRRKQTQGNREKDQKAVMKSPSPKRITLQNHFLNRDIEVAKADLAIALTFPNCSSNIPLARKYTNKLNTYLPCLRKKTRFKLLRTKAHVYLPNTDVTKIEPEKPVIFSLEEVDEATNNFDETKKIGEGGYGSVYFGIIRGWEVAIKKMKASKTKEFFVELKVLCRIHHINVVELLGYASGDNHLYLVYDYVQNGSLNDHLHDPLLKGKYKRLCFSECNNIKESGHQPLSWTARAHIALDAARGVEYIHDHTKARYVHRDIKTANILLDRELRAKIADFGLAKLVERSNDGDFIATRLVGTPGYLPPESLSELQTTSKTDVFAFGVVLSELITGQRALVRDDREPNKMKSLISLMHAIFSEKDCETALESSIDSKLTGSYPKEEVHKVDATNRPEMREIVTILDQILMSSIEWEALLGGNSQVFSGLLSGR